MIKISRITDVTEHIDGLRAVIFDLDDTLYSEREYVKSGFAAVAEILPEINNAGERLYSLFELGKNAIDELLISEGLYSAQLKERCLEAYRSHAPKIHLYGGVHELLLALRQEGYMLGIITDGRPDGQRAKIRALGLEPLLDEIIVTDELGGAEYRKPCDKAFRLMHEKISARLGMEIAFAETCYVGDNTSKDFIAPDSLGMRSVWFDNPEGIYYLRS